MIEGSEVCEAYLLGLLAKIKCSICSYQCENWYTRHCLVVFHIYFSTSRLISACTIIRTGVLGIALPPCDADPFGGLKLATYLIQFMILFYEMHSCIHQLMHPPTYKTSTSPIVPVVLHKSSSSESHRRAQFHRIPKHLLWVRVVHGFQFTGSIDHAYDGSLKSWE